MGYGASVQSADPAPGRRVGRLIEDRMPEQLSKEEIEALRDMAANRGCRLVRSRRRKPSGDFGRLGLTDLKSGKEVFGFGKKGLEATPEEIESFLRGSTVSTWKKSLAAAGKGGAAKAAHASRTKAESKPATHRNPHAAPAAPARSPKPAPPPRPEPNAPAAEPKLRIRNADAVDGEAIAPLLAELGYEAEADGLADRIGRHSRISEPVLVAKLGDTLVGCLTWHVMPVIHRPQPVGRITMLVVAQGARRKGIGRALVEAAESRLRQRGCGLVEVTSNVKLKAAHAFYRRLGFERTSHRFAKALGS
jgi:ribosomal protein S18 acetylase RimI-like enzyme